MGEIGLNQFAPYLMNRVIARWNANLADDLKALDITTAKMRALAILSITPSVTINELSVFAVTEQSTMSRTLDSLEEQGFIRRQPRARRHAHPRRDDHRGRPRRLRAASGRPCMTTSCRCSTASTRRNTALSFRCCTAYCAISGCMRFETFHQPFRTKTCHRRSPVGSCRHGTTSLDVRLAVSSTRSRLGLAGTDR